MCILFLSFAAPGLFIIFLHGRREGVEVEEKVKGGGGGSRGRRLYKKRGRPLESKKGWVAAGRQLRQAGRQTGK